MLQLSKLAQERNHKAKEDKEKNILARENKEKKRTAQKKRRESNLNMLDNSFEYALNLGTTETDGCEVTTAALGDKFPNGLFVSMNDNDEKNFFYHDLSRLKAPVKAEE